MTQSNVRESKLISVVTPTGGLRVEGQVNGKALPFLVDTGAAVTLISRDTWDKLLEERAKKLEQCDELKLVGVDGSPLTIHGKANVCISLDGQSYPMTVVVVSPLTTQAILGLDFMTEYNVCIDVGKGQLHVKQQPPNCLKEHIKTSGVGNVQLVGKIDLPPLSERVVMANVEALPQGGTYVVERKVGKGLPCCVARTLVVIKNDKVPVRLLNPKPEPVQLKAGTIIAKVERVDALCEPKKLVASVATSNHTNLEVENLFNSIVESCRANLKESEKELFFALLSEYADVFTSSSTDFGRTDMLDHEIHTNERPPIRQAARRLPPHRRQEVQKLLKEMLEKEVIQPSKSPWASPIVLVKKKDNSFRFCVDYRKLNEVTHKDAYPLPRIDDTLNTLAGSEWFSTLDLLSGYWQVGVAKKDRPKTAFCTSEGLFEFNVMPFGLCNAPATFQRLMDLVLSGLHWSHCVVYLDDVIILGRTFADHLRNLREVLSRLRQAGLKLQPKKCQFFQHEVAFLGHVVSGAGVAADPSKLDKVTTWPTPQTTKEVQQFLGFAGYYRRFIKDFAQKAKPLHKLTEHKVEFRWTSDCQIAFDTLKQYLTSAPVLAYPDYHKPFILDTDASDTGLGAVLSQLDDHGQEKVIAYGSRLLSKPERQYCVTRRELLAAVVFTRHFRSFLLGTTSTLRTDHSSLTWLQKFKEPEGQMARWLQKLQEYNFIIVHRPGKKHCNADALSRLPCRQCGRDEHIPIATTSLYQPDDVSQGQSTDPVINPVLRAKMQHEKPDEAYIKSLSLPARRLFQLWDQLTIRDGILYRQYLQDPSSNSPTIILQLLIPESKREEILRDTHSGAMGGHLGEEKTFVKVKQRFYWPGYHKDVLNWCKTCPDCAATKASSRPNHAALQNIKVGSPMQMVAVDILGPFPESEGRNRYILVVGDYFTRWMEAFAIANQEATTVARILTQEVFCRFSVPEQLHTDQGKQFESDVIAEICKLLGIAKTRTTPYHPQSDGLVERFNRTLLSMLRTAAAEHPFDWEKHLRPLCMTYNSSIQSSTGHSPFYLMFGRKPRLPLDLMYGDNPLASDDPKSFTEFACDLKQRLQKAYDQVRTQTAAKLDRQKEIYDKRIHGKPYSNGDLVWLHSRVVPNGVGRKLHRPWTGPFCVLAKLSDAVYRIQNPRVSRQRLVVHFDRLKPCHPKIRLEHVIKSRFRHREPTNSGPPGTNLQVNDEFVEDDVPTGTERRYPTRDRHPPRRHIPYVPTH